MNFEDDKLVELLQKFIRTKTCQPLGNEMALARPIKHLLDEHGIENTLYDLGDNRANLIARVPGQENTPGLLFSAHLDTIAVNADQWEKDPFGGEIADGKMYGRGTTDMKSGLAAMLAAVIEVSHWNRPLSGDLILALTAAENTSNLGARKIVEAGLLPKVGALLVSEPSSLDLFVAEKGALWIDVKASGEYGHNAFSEDRSGDRGNAIVRMAQFLSRVPEIQLAATHPLLRPPTINVGLVSGGDNPALIPDECRAMIDVRTLPGMQPEAVLAKFRAVAGDHIDLAIADFKPPVDTPPDHPFVTVCRQAVRDVLKRVPRVKGVPYYSDAAVLSPALGLPMVIIGPGETGLSGAVDEYVVLDKLFNAKRIYLNIVEKYFS